MRRAAGAAAAAVAALMLMSATPAWASGVIRGVVPDVSSGRQVRAALVAHPANLPYDGGEVLHTNRTHVIFWQPSGSGLSYDPGYEALVERFFADVAADSHHPTNVYGLTGQYTDIGGPAVYQSTFGGAVLDTDSLPPNGCRWYLEPLPTGWHVCLTDEQLQQEIDHVVQVDHLPRRLNDVYFLVTPNGFGSCYQSGHCTLGGSPNGYCGYHSQTDQQLLYAFIPYNAVSGHCQSGKPRPNGSTADPTISTISHEHNEAITDPIGDAWINSSNSEDGDLCLTQFGGNLGGTSGDAWNEVIHGEHYYLQEEWSNEDGKCEPRDETDKVSFARPRRPVTGTPVVFTGHARDPDGSITAFNWFVGERGVGRHKTLTHTFHRPGTYRVTLRSTDGAGNWAFATRTIHVS